MTEFQLGWLATVAWVAVAVFATLYWVGGTAGSPGKRVRRIWGGLFLALATIGLSLAHGTFEWWFLMSLLTLPGALSLGYGGAHGSARLFWRRTLFGLAVSANGWVFALPVGGLLWVVALFQTVLGTLASVVFGMVNPFQSARKEEAVIGGLSVVLLPFIV